ncbi:MAG: DUF4397 domain-containing protein [Gemmatimonadaceae bacterium]
MISPLKMLVRPRWARRPGILAAAIAVLSACGTTDAPEPLSPSGPTGRVRFVNVITDTTRGRVNAILEQVPFGVNLTYTQSTPISLAAPNTAPYAAVLAGSRSIVLKRTADTGTTVATLTFTVAGGEDRTVYAIGGAAASAISAFVTTDSNAAPSATQARVRVVHLSPTAGNVDVFVTAPVANLATATPTLSNVAYRATSAYLTLAAGTYQVRAVPAGTAAVDRAANVSINLASVVLPGGRGRTVVAADRSLGGAPLTAFVLTDR